jgi:membrane associated rhomboid family serine protease
LIFPIGDDNIEGGHKPIVSYSLIGINVIIFLIQLSIGEETIYHFASVPEEITHGNRLFTLITSMFLHGGTMHLIGNMLFLWIFGDNIEAIIGSSMFLLFYLFGGLFAAGAHILTDPHSIIPMIGASGAISAVMGAYMVMFPKSRVKMIFIVFFKKFHIPAFLFLIFWFLQQIFSGITTFGGIGPGGGVAWWAHIGGFAFGIVVGLVLKQKFKDLYSYKIAKV